jgi:hypothetical protein
VIGLLIHNIVVTHFANGINTEHHDNPLC